MALESLQGALAPRLGRIVEPFRGSSISCNSGVELRSPDKVTNDLSVHGANSTDRVTQSAA